MELQSRRMGEILDRINDKTEAIKKDFTDHFIRTRFKKRTDDFERSLMILSGGDVIQYKELKRININEYLVKLDNFVSSIESQIKK